MIRTRDLTKTYGTVRALSGVSLDIPSGVVCGLVGPNGAGKSTLLGVLAELRRPTSGSIGIEAAVEQRALMPDTPQFDPWLTAREVVALSRWLVGRRRDPQRVTEVLAFAGLESAADRRVGGFSRGMLQRLGLAASIVNDPQLLMMDEPASALDPQGRYEMLSLISDLRGQATVLFSSHILSDVQAVCDYVAVLDEGRLLFQGTMKSLLAKGGPNRYLLRVADRREELVQAFRGERWVSEVALQGADEIRLGVLSNEEAQLGIIGIVAATGARLVAMTPDEPSLEEIFLELTR